MPEVLSLQRNVATKRYVCCIEVRLVHSLLLGELSILPKRTFDFYTFEPYYLDLPAPFQASSVDIRQELARINNTQYAVGILTAVSRRLES
jgi:hypothetical protein